MKSRTRLNPFVWISLIFVFVGLFYYCKKISTITENIVIAETKIQNDSQCNVSEENSTIHVVLIVVDSESPKKTGISVCERVETLLKSILVFYSGTLHLHLLANTRSGKTLSTLFRTWPVSRVRTSFYNVEEDQKGLEWVNSTHEVSGYGQLKYIIADILPEYVEKVIFIDTDMLMLEDISVLHSYFTEMIEKGIMFASTSDQYNRTDLEKSLGKGASQKSVNSGLLLYNLKRMREGSWENLWREEGVRLMNKLGKLVCPQDLLAAVAIAKPELYLKLPCEYNFQIGKGALLWNCVKNETELVRAKIPHWTNTKKYYQTLGHTAVFSPIYRCFQKMDGYDFEMKSRVMKYRTLLNIRNGKHNEKKEDVTLAVHVPFDEVIELMQRLNSTWLGPISLVVCGTSWDRAELLSFIFNNSLHDGLNVHFVYSRNEGCPVDYLRRVSIDVSRTNTLLISDIISSIEVDDELRTKLVMSNITRSATLLYKDKEFSGVVLGKPFAQRLAAGSTGVEEGVKAMKLKINNIEVDSPAQFVNPFNVTKWELEMPSDSFCQQEINRRMNMN